MLKWILVLAIALMCAACDEHRSVALIQGDGLNQFRMNGWMLPPVEDQILNAWRRRPFLLRRIDFSVGYYRDAANTTHVCRLRRMVCDILLRDQDVRQESDGTYTVLPHPECLAAVPSGDAYIDWGVYDYATLTRTVSVFPPGIGPYSPGILRIGRLPECPQQQ